MLAGTYNIKIDQGSTFYRRITMTNPDGSLYDLTGHTARMQIRREVDDPDVVLELTTQNGRITLGGDEGTIELNLTAQQTSTVTRDGVYDLEIVDDAGRPYRVLRGAVRVNPEVTR